MVRKAKTAQNGGWKMTMIHQQNKQKISLLVCDKCLKNYGKCVLVEKRNPCGGEKKERAFKD